MTFCFNYVSLLLGVDVWNFRNVEYMLSLLIITIPFSLSVISSMTILMMTKS